MPTSSAVVNTNATGPCTTSNIVIDPTVTFEIKSGDRLPAIVSSGSAALSFVLLGAQTGIMAHYGLKEAGPGLSSAGLDMDVSALYGSPGNSLGGGGAEFGGVGGGVGGFDFGMFDLLDAAQFVMIAGQLNLTATPHVVGFFAEYFVPFTGLLPLSLAKDLGDSIPTRSWTPTGVTALLKPGTWGGDVTPADLFPYSVAMLILWSFGVMILWLVLALVAPACLQHRDRVRSAQETMALRRRSSFVGQVPDTVGPWSARLLKLVGFVVRVYVTMYYILAMLALFEMWDSTIENGFDLAAAVVVLIAVIFPVLFAAFLGSRDNRALNYPGSKLRLAFGPLFASFSVSKKTFFLINPLGDRLVSAAIIVFASRRPTLQLFLLFGKQALVLSALLKFKPLRHAGVHSFTVAMAIVRCIVLLLSLAFIQGAVTDTEDVYQLFGWVVALVHVATFLSILYMACIKLTRACASRSLRYKAPPKLADGPIGFVQNPMSRPVAAGARSPASATSVEGEEAEGGASTPKASSKLSAAAARVDNNPLFAVVGKAGKATPEPTPKAVKRVDANPLFADLPGSPSGSPLSSSGSPSDQRARQEFAPQQARSGALGHYRASATRGRGRGRGAARR